MTTATHAQFSATVAAAIRNQTTPVDLATLPPAIGLSGFAGAGKTAAAEYLQQRDGYKRLHIAEPLRDMLRPLLRAFGLPDTMIERYLTGDLKESVIPEIGCTSRQLQIRLGMWGRRKVHKDLWADAWQHTSERQHDRPMNDSVRFPNEQHVIHDMGGLTILIVRPGTAPAAYRWGKLGRGLYRWLGLMWGVHDSERVDRLRPDVTIVNDGTLKQLYDKLDIELKRFGILCHGE